MEGKDGDEEEERIENINLESHVSNSSSHTVSTIFLPSSFFSGLIIRAGGKEEEVIGLSSYSWQILRHNESFELVYKATVMPYRPLVWW